MRIRKWVALAATASIAFWAPSVVPVKAQLVSCGATTTIDFRTVDTAYAAPLPLPCPVSHTPSPWPAVTVIVGVVGVMVNAIYIWNTQCRELTSQEAVTSTFLPFIGMAFDAQASKCHR
ncbi:MAG: hypothetical protein ABSF67_10780 [Roseiarcus sp.]|jgi:hypothetical protein